MTDGCCPRIKQIEATIVRYKKSKPNVEEGKSCVEAEKETNQFQGRVTHLKSKLDEANANIAMLRAWVSQADIDISQTTTPKTPKSKCEKLNNTVDELKELIVKLNGHQHQAKVVVERSVEAGNIYDEIANQKCYCALVSESCENIKQALADILEEKEELEETINQLKNPGQADPGIAEEKLAAVRKEIQGVKTCTIMSCPTLNEKETGSKDAGNQNSCCPPSKIPKLMQTDSKRKWNQGTSPCCEGKCNKSTGR